MVKPFEELFVEPRTWKFKSSSSDKEYTVTEGKWLYCDCWGYIAHKRCKHIKKVKEQLEFWDILLILRYKIKVMEKVIKYINNNIVEFRAVVDTVILAGIFYVAAIACKFLILYFA